MGALTEPNVVDFARLHGTFCSQQKVAGLRTTVVGAGALGNEVVRILGLLGVGTITVIDPDRVAATDFTRSVLLRGRSGQNKAEAIMASAQVLFPDTKFAAFPCEVADVGFADFLPTDVIFGCTDSDLSRLELAYISTRLNLPLLDGGLSTADMAEGRVSYFPGTGAACYACLLTGARRAELLARWESPVNACSPLESQDGLGYSSTPMMASMIAALQVDGALRAREGSCSSAFSWRVCVHPEPVLEKLHLRRSAGCPFHDEEDARAEPPGEDCSVAQYLGRVAGSGALVLDWPVCVRARCVACGFRWAPMCRLGFLHRRGACPECGSQQIRALDTIAELSSASPLAALRFRGLGLSPAHPYTVRVKDRP